MSLFPDILGTAPGVFLGLTVIFMGGCAFLAGQALATTWRPAWRMLPYGLLMGAADRFLDYALFQGRLWSAGGYLVASGVLMASGLLAYRTTRARQMANQYPWLYERHGLFGWRARNHRPET